MIAVGRNVRNFEGISHLLPRKCLLRKHFVFLYLLELYSIFSTDEQSGELMFSSSYDLKLSGYLDCSLSCPGISSISKDPPSLF